MSLREAFEYTIEVCESDETFAEYAAREKFLALAFTFIQTLNKESNKFVPLLSSKKIFFISNSELEKLKQKFTPYAVHLLDEATQNGEIVTRPFINKTYPTLLWQAFLQILHFWSLDKSNNKEETDVIIEKSIHFTFDTLAPNALDSGFDYLKFLIQKRK